MPGVPSRSADRTVAYVVLALVAGVFLLLAADRITGPFGDSDEGINAAVWGADSRALRELGPIDSALGGRRGDGTSYANHPPMIVITAAAAEVVAGEHTFTTRAPAWLGALASIPLLYWLGRRARLGALPAAAGAATAALTPMFVVYGPMLDTPVTSFPFGVAVLALWVRDLGREGDEPPRWWAVAGCSALACLAGWQAALLVAACAVGVAAARRSNPGAAVRHAAPYAGGGLVGLAGSIGWIWWVYGDLAPLTDKFSQRAADASTGYLDVVSFQVPWIVQLLGLSVVGLVACAVAAVRDRPLRPLATLSLVVTFLYAFVFKEAAAGHQYWMYWVLLPTAVGGGYLARALLRKVRAEASGPATPRAAIVGLLAVVGAVNLIPTTSAERQIVDGQRVGSLVEAMGITGAHQAGTPVRYVGQDRRPEDYVRYILRADSERVDGPEALEALADDAPQAPVLVLTTCDDGDAWCHEVVSAVAADGPALVTAGELAARTGSAS